MTLLEPAAAAIAGAVALPALAVLYLLKLRRRPVRVSSTLLWRESYQDLEANIPWRWVRPSWLFLLHAVLVGLLVLAIGRPAIGGSGSAASSTMVIIIDGSASMSALDGQGGPGDSSRFDEARRRAQRVVDEAMRTGRGVRAGVISVAATARTLVPITWDRRLVRSAIESAEPTDQPLDLDAAMELAGAMLGGIGDPTAETPTPGQRPLVLVFSDGASSGPGVRAPPGAEVRLERVGPSPTGVSPEPPPGQDNAGIVALSARRDAANPALVRIFAEFHNALGRPRAAAISVTFDGAERERRAVEIPPSDGDSPGVLTATFEVSTRDEGVVGIELVGRDLLSADDRAWITIAAPRPPRILLVMPDPPAPGGEAAAPDSDTPTWVIESILRELNPASIRSTPESAAYTAVRSAAGIYDLIVFDRVTPAIAPPVPSIVLGGGLPALGTVSPEPGEDTGERDAVLSWDRNHPLLRDVTLDAVYALPGSTLIEPDGRPTGVTSTDLARGASGPLIVLVEAGGVRHVAVGFGLDRSNWGLQVGFTIFLANAVDFLTVRPEDEAGVGRRTADVIEAVVPTSVNTVVLLGPERIETPAPAVGTVSDLGRLVSLGRVRRAGVYEVSPSSVTPRVFAVNLLDADETSLRTAEDLGWQASSRRDRGGASSPTGREIGTHLLVAALVLLMVEWLLYARHARGA